MVLLSVSLASLSPPSSVGLDMLLCISWTDTCNKKIGTNCVSNLTPMDNFRQSFAIGECKTWGCCRIQL